MHRKHDVHLMPKFGYFAGGNDSNIVVKDVSKGIKTNIGHKEKIFYSSMEKKRKKVTTESKLLIMLARNNIRKNVKVVFADKLFQQNNSYQFPERVLIKQSQSCQSN